jgi:hypothetical protein
LAALRPARRAVVRPGRHPQRPPSVTTRSKPSIAAVKKPPQGGRDHATLMVINPAKR